MFGKNKSLFLKLLTVFLMAMLIAGCGSKQEEEVTMEPVFDAEAFEDGMKAVMNSADEIIGNKAIALVYEDESEDAVGVYSKDYVPEEYKTDDPTEVRFIIERVHGSISKGEYFGTKIMASQYEYIIGVKDLILDTSVEKTFLGGNPPETIMVEEFGEEGEYYGSKPDEEEISAWVISAIKEFEQLYLEQLEVEQTEEPIEGVNDTKEQALECAIEYIEDGSYGYGPNELLSVLVDYDGFSLENAEYAVQNCGADWSQEAIECAKSYDSLELGFSYLSLLDSLEFTHGFTKEEAQYAVDNCGNDWNKAAVDAVNWALEYDEITYTRDEMIAYLQDVCLFTEEQAFYGVDTCGIE